MEAAVETVTSTAADEGEGSMSFSHMTAAMPTVPMHIPRIRFGMARRMKLRLASIRKSETLFFFLSGAEAAAFSVSREFVAAAASINSAAAANPQRETVL